MDDEGESNSSTLTITVTGAYDCPLLSNTTPEATVDTGIAPENGTTDFDVLVGDKWITLYIEVTNNSTGNVTADILIYPAWSATIDGAIDNTLQDSIIVGNVALHHL